MLNNSALKKTEAEKRGFSLTESAIVLGVIGIVVAAIWATASVVRARGRINDAVHIVTDIATNVRGSYTGFPGAAAPDLAGQIGMGLYPMGALNDAGNATVNPWGGAFAIAFVGGATVGNGFAVEINLPASMERADRTDACLGLVTRHPPTATNYTGAFNGDLPSGVVAIDPVQGIEPSFAFISASGSWTNVTAETISVMTGYDCLGVAFYFRM